MAVVASVPTGASASGSAPSGATRTSWMTLMAERRPSPPDERESRFWPFAFGAAAYAGLLLLAG